MSWWNPFSWFSSATPMTQDFIKINGRITRYGYPNDETPDSLTEEGSGAWGNKLRPTSIAVSRDVEAQFRRAGILPMQQVEIRTGLGILLRTWDDRTARKFNGKILEGRFDIYCQRDENKQLDGIAVTGFRRSESA